jgi:chromosome segregation ATPase
MKVFIETKQEEIRLGKVQTDELTAELEQTNRLLREQTSRWKQLHAQWAQSQTRNRELQRDLNRIKKDSDDMHKIGDKMEMKLSRSAQETEEHKTKRLTAKHELMTVLRTLEGEREVSCKLRDSIKFTFTPKALSQQQLLKESLQEFEVELQNLSGRLGRPYLSPTDPPNLFSADDSADGQTNDVASVTNDEDADEAESVLKNKSAIDSTHLISNLENETPRVSQSWHLRLASSACMLCWKAMALRLVLLH